MGWSAAARCVGPELALCPPAEIDLEFEMDCRRVLREVVI
jgi:hypothetical protein